MLTSSRRRALSLSKPIGATTAFHLRQRKDRGTKFLWKSMEREISSPAATQDAAARHHPRHGVARFAVSKRGASADAIFAGGHCARLCVDGDIPTGTDQSVPNEV